jgi:hypothetical protein
MTRVLSWTATENTLYTHCQPARSGLSPLAGFLQQRDAILERNIASWSTNFFLQFSDYILQSADRLCQQWPTGGPRAGSGLRQVSGLFSRILTSQL